MPRGLKLSQSGQMRLQHAAGLTVSEVAKMFDVSYHTAYSACVHRARADARLVTQDGRQVALTSVDSNGELLERRSHHHTAGARKPVRDMTASQLAELSEEELIRLFNAPAPTKLQRLDRAVATNEIDRRDEVAGTIGLDGGGLYARAYGGISPELV